MKLYLIVNTCMKGLVFKETDAGSVGKLSKEMSITVILPSFVIRADERWWFDPLYWFQTKFCTLFEEDLGHMSRKPNTNAIHESKVMKREASLANIFFGQIFAQKFPFFI